MRTSSSLALRESRHLFHGFYVRASVEDAAAMDVLVMAYISVTLGILVPRRQMPAGTRMSIERNCDRAEREFLRARDQVRDCETYRTLSPEEQKRVASLFELFVPTDN